MNPFTISELRAEPQIVRPGDVPAGEARVLLLVVAHSDDPAFFVSGAVALWARAGWRVVCLRVTDDRWDSFGLDEEETIRRNAAELRQAADILGMSEVVDLGWQTDVLGDASRVALRERIIHAIRRFKPYGLVTFDPDSLFYEDNLDHRVLAQAVDEAYWTAQFDKHHPEHFNEGLMPHGTYERWYFGRTIASVTHVFDTSSVVDVQLDALLCHTTPLTNIVQQMHMQAQTAGVAPALIDRAMAGELRPLFEQMLRVGLRKKGQPFGLAAAETLRLHRAYLPTE